MRTRIEETANYSAVYINGKTIRFPLDDTKPITELLYPEFLDIKITGNCDGKCPYCYMDSKPENHYENIIDKSRNFFNSIPTDKLPFQVALGGGEPTSHPDFIELLRVLKEEYDICPNYTTNGMWVKNGSEYIKNLLDATKKYSGGVAVSCHPHLKDYWKEAAKKYIKRNVKLNFHIIISDRESIDYFVKIFNKWENNIDYFVLLPYGYQGRAEEKEIDWGYLLLNLPKNQSKIAFGANFYPYLKNNKHNINISLYEPEIMSKFLSLEDLSIYSSSFNLKKLK